MGTHSSDFRSVTRKHHRANKSLFRQGQPFDADRDVSDGGGEGFMLCLLAIILSALIWWLI